MAPFEHIIMWKMQVFLTVYNKVIHLYRLTTSRDRPVKSTETRQTRKNSGNERQEYYSISVAYTISTMRIVMQQM